MNTPLRTFPVNVSNRHIHMTTEVFEKLFGEGKNPTKVRDLMQTGEFASAEKVTLLGKCGKKIENIRVLGPCRKSTQCEISMTDARTLGLDPVPPVRISGNIEGSHPLSLIGSTGIQVDLSQGLIIAKAHIHVPPEVANEWGMKHGDEVRAHMEGARALDMSLIIRSYPGAVLECHIDTDEGGACGIDGRETVKGYII